MKKLTILCIGMALTLFMLTACSGGSSATTKATTAPPATTTTQAETVPPSDIVGGFTENREATAEDKAIFNEAMGDKASKYEIQQVATQVVAGTNYRFLVKVTDGDKVSEANVFIFKSLNADEKAQFVKEEPLQVKS